MDKVYRGLRRIHRLSSVETVWIYTTRIVHKINGHIVRYNQHPGDVTWKTGPIIWQNNEVKQYPIKGVK